VNESGVALFLFNPDQPMISGLLYTDCELGSPGKYGNAKRDQGIGIVLTKPRLKPQIFLTSYVEIFALHHFM